jgi:hypothetical protein
MNWKTHIAENTNSAAQYLGTVHRVFVQFARMYQISDPDQLNELIQEWFECQERKKGGFIPGAL